MSCGRVEVLKIETEKNLADALTKVLTVAKFDLKMNIVHVVKFDPGGKDVP